MQDYRRLVVSALAEDVAVETYRVTSTFPPSERYELARQMRRAAVSIGSNIAEGAGQRTDGDFRRLLGIAMGSASELHFQARLAARLGLCGNEDSMGLQESIENAKKAIAGLIRYLNKRER